MISRAMEDYLKAIYQSASDDERVSTTRLADKMSCSAASVTNMLQRLDAEGFVKHEKYRGTVLTDEGQRIAQAIIDRHELLTEFLRLFKIDEETIYRDVEGMEHHVSRATLNALRAVTETLRESQEFRDQVLKKLAP